jgi:hypothetical protein
MDDIIKVFLWKYAEKISKALGDPPEVDVEGMANAFTDCYIESSPAGVVCINIDDKFRAKLSERMTFYRSIGTKSMKIVSVDVTEINDLNALAKVHWDSRYMKKDGTEVAIEFDIFYLIQVKDKTPKIFAYISGDEQKALQEKGLLSKDLQR